MASRTERSRNLLGGMQLLPPSDKLADGNSLVVQNFRVDQENQLVSRKGTYLYQGPMGSGWAHTLARSQNNEFLGVGTEVYRNPYGSLLAGGFDGQPLGIAFYGEAAWIMNQGRRVRAWGQQARQWGMDAPTSAPTATGGGQVIHSIDEFSGGPISVAVHQENVGDGTYTTYAMVDGTAETNELAVAEFAPITGAPGGGTGLKITAKEAATISGYVKKSINTVLDGKTEDDDLIRVWVYVSDPNALEAITVYLKCGTTGYAEYAFTTPAKALSQSLNSWTQIKIRRHLNLDDFQERINAATANGNQTTISDLEAQFATAIQTPTFVYTGSGWPQTGNAPPPSTYPPSDAMLAVDWSAITEFGVSFKVTEACQVGIADAEAAGTPGNNSTGAITYWYSFFNDKLEDSNPSPPSNAVITGAETVTLTDIAVSPDPHAVGRYVWRSGGGLSQALRVAVISDNTTTTWVDDTTNRKAQVDDVVMPIDRDLPPAAFGVIGPIYGKMIAFNTLAHPSRYFWTPAARPWYFPGADDEFVGNWEDAGSDDDAIIAATDHRPITVFYKNRSIWKLVGDPDSNDVQQSNAQIGIYGPKCAVKDGSLDYCAGSEGIYSFNGDFLDKYSQQIDPIFKGDFVPLADGVTLYPISQENAYRSCIAVNGRRLYFSYPEQGQNYPNVVLVCNLDTRTWSRYYYDNLAQTGFSAMLNEGSNRGFLGAANGGYMYYIEAQGRYLDVGTTAQGVWQSRYMDQGFPNNNKVYTDIEVDCATAGAFPNTTLTVKALFNNGTSVTLGTLTSSDTTKPRFTGMLEVPGDEPDQVGFTAQNVAIRIECDIAGEVRIYGVYVHYYVEERIARTFDTGPIDLGMPERVKQIDHVEMYMTANGQGIKNTIFSDLPHNLLDIRESSTINAPSGRGTSHRRISIVEGRNFRFTLADTTANTSIFQLHKVRVRFRPVGEYIDGAVSPTEYYECPEFSVEPGRVGELKDLLLDYDVSGPGGYLEIYTDLPNGMAARARWPIPYHATRAIEVFPFETPTLTAPYNGVTNLPFGQLFKVRLYPPAGGILRLHGRAEFRARLIGTYFNGANGEIFETQPLDLMDGMGIFKEMEIVAAVGGPMYLEMLTELPGQQMRVSARMLVPAGTDSRGPIRARCPGNTKGHLQQFRLVGPYVARLYDIRVFARKTQTGDSGWNWLKVPFERTPSTWAQFQMPVRTTPEAFEWAEIPVDAIE